MLFVLCFFSSSAFTYCTFSLPNKLLVVCVEVGGWEEGSWRISITFFGFIGTLRFRVSYNEGQQFVSDNIGTQMPVSCI